MIVLYLAMLNLSNIGGSSFWSSTDIITATVAVKGVMLKELLATTVSVYGSGLDSRSCVKKRENNR